MAFVRYIQMLSDILSQSVTEHDAVFAILFLLFGHQGNATATLSQLSANAHDDTF